MTRFLKYLYRFIAIILVILFITAVSYYQKDLPVDKLIAKYCNQDDHFMNLMGMQVHYRDEGNRSDSLPIVFIHGTAASLFTWDSTVTILKDKKRIIRFDLPAFALTGPNPEKDYSIEYYTHFVDSFLTRLQVNQCILVGNSLGGNIAWSYTIAHTEKVSKLVLVDAGGMRSSVQPKGAIGFKIAQIPVLNNIVKYITPKALVIKSLHQAYGDPSKVKDWQENRYFDLLIRQGNREALINRFKSNLLVDETEKIMQIKTPTLIIWGDQDQLIPVENAYKFNKAITGSELEIMKGVGHVPMEESPTAFAKRLGIFIDKK
ncbi:MAG: alpha/beta hydrolase [Bacteroidota bacterium]